MSGDTSVFRLGLRAARAVQPFALYLSFLGLAIPLAAFRFASGRWAIDKAKEIGGLDLSSGSALPLIQIIGDYTSSYLTGAVVCALFVGWAYVCTLDAFAQAVSGRGRKVRFRLLPKRLGRVLLSGPLFLVCLALLLMFGQAMPFVAVMISILWLMAPVIMLFEGKGAWRSLKESLFLRYATAAQGRRRFAFFRLMSIGFGTYAGILAVMMGSEAFLRLDEVAPIPRTLWYSFVPHVNLPVAYLAQGLLASTLEAFFLMFLGLFTVSLYVAVQGVPKRSAEPSP